ncbi:MAG: hypothetical protein KKE50_06125 [Nanoarchaeota archaeon]|nr:hypothetical protein [Nanoarchaeota archaeon]
MCLKKKKAGMSIAIVLLVFGVLILCVYSLYSFNTRKKSFDDVFVVSHSVGDIYARELVINFYIQEIVDSVGVSSDKNDFISKFKAELVKYKVNGKYLPEELEQAEKQLVPENIFQGKTSFGVDISITLSESEKVGDVERYSAVYSYKKRFGGQKANKVCPSINFKKSTGESSYVFYSGWVESEVYLSSEQKASFDNGLDEILVRNSLSENVEVQIYVNQEIKYSGVVLKGGANREKVAAAIKSVMLNYCVID